MNQRAAVPAVEVKDGRGKNPEFLEKQKRLALVNLCVICGTAFERSKERANEFRYKKTCSYQCYIELQRKPRKKYLHRTPANRRKKPTLQVVEEPIQIEPTISTGDPGRSLTREEIERIMHEITPINTISPRSEYYEPKFDGLVSN